MRCKEAIYKRDTYRRTGRGKTGFEMHYNMQQCARKAVDDKHCWQHMKRCFNHHLEWHK